MSSPIHHADDVDAELVYAPPWAREGRKERRPLSPSAALLEAPPQRIWRRGDRPFSGDLAMTKLQRQMALKPDAVPEPPLDNVESLWPIVLRLIGVAAVAAAVAWLAVMVPQARQSRGEAAQPDAAATSVAVKDESADPLRTPEAAGLLLQHGLAATAMPAETVALATPPAQAVPPDAQASPLPTIAMPPPAEAPPAPPPPPAPKTLQLAADEIATLVKRGKDALSSGDLAAARLLLRRAAEAGNADAALALGATFDPLVIRRIGAIGAEPDAARARQWYQKAAALGSSAAAQPLAALDAAAKP
jgi:hypothetical protein